ncbi:MAG: response regulator [Bacteriovoracaceae bacterium]
MIEDDQNQSMMLKNRIEDEGYKCVVAASRVETVMKLENQEFDLIVSDLNIKGSEGGQTLESIFVLLDQNKLDSPVIIVSGFLDKSVLTQYGKKVVGAFVKPVDHNLLLQKVHSLLQDNES